MNRKYDKQNTYTIFKSEIILLNFNPFSKIESRLDTINLFLYSYTTVQ